MKLSRKENNESMAAMYQHFAADSYRNYEIAINEGRMKRASFWQRQQARDFKVAYLYLLHAIYEKSYE